MELPSKLKTLYKHWNKHLTPHGFKSNSKINTVLLEQVEQFASERMYIWEKKELGETAPYSKDKILQKYRFCNIYRELDRQTIEFHTILNDLRNNFPLWLLNMAYCRFVCKPNTVSKTGLLNFNKENNKKAFENLMDLPNPKYGSAYVFPISAIQKSETPTREEFFCYYLPNVIEEIASIIDAFENESVVNALEKILPSFGFNFKFHWTEILIDVAYQYPEKINLFAEFPIGPGAIPTMKRLSKVNPQKTCLTLTKYQPKKFPYLTYSGKSVLLSAENWEGIGCEFRKYSNLKLGKGRVRKYRT